jgi:hypothetical protein
MSKVCKLLEPPKLVLSWETEVTGQKAVMKVVAEERLPMSLVFTGFIDHCVYMLGAPLQAEWV